MDRKAHDEWMAEFDRKSLEAYKNHDPNGPWYSSERVHAFLVELERRCNEAGMADRAIVEELKGKLERGEAF